MRTQRSARSHGRLLVAVVLTVGVAGVGPAWATGMDPLGDVTETVDQVTGPVDDVVDQGHRAGGEGRGPAGGEGRGPGSPEPVEEGRGPQVPEPVEGTVDQVTGAVDDTAEAAAGAGQETTPGAGAPGGRGAEEGSGAGSGGSKDREGRKGAGTSAEHGGVSKRSAGTVEASSPGLAPEGWYQGMPDAGGSQVRAASGPCPNGIDEACLLDAFYGAGAGAAEVLGIRRLATTGLGLLALAMIALLAAGSGGAMLTWSGRRERRRAPQPPFQVPL